MTITWDARGDTRRWRRSSAGDARRHGVGGDHLGTLYKRVGTRNELARGFLCTSRIRRSVPLMTDHGYRAHQVGWTKKIINVQINKHVS
jgi:hypothetical protein